MTVISVWVGGVTESAARVKAKLTGTSVRLAVSTNADLSAPVFFGPVAPDAQGVATLAADGLTANTQHYYAIEEDGVLDTIYPGQFRTHPPTGAPASFHFAASSCAGGNATVPGVDGSLYPAHVSNAPGFDAIHTAEPLFFAHLGDLNYYNFGDQAGTELADYRRALDDVLLQPRQHNLYRNIPLVYVWDDHDFGANNSDSTNPGRANAQQVYREKVPSYPLPSAEGIYHSFQVGRVLFIASDSRSYRTPDTEPDGPDKTLLGAEQKAWMRQVLSSSDAAAFVWLDQTPWTESPTDTWSGFATERAELASMFEELGWADRMIMIYGDTHAMGFDSGADNPLGGFPLYLVGSLDSNWSGNRGDYDIGFSAARNQYGIFNVTDDGKTVTITATGYQNGSPLFSHTVTFGSGQPTPTVASNSVVGRPQWIAADARTGMVLADLPTFVPSWPLRRTLCKYDTANGELYLDGAPSNWEAAVREGAAVLACYYDDGTPTPQIQWAGLVTQQTRDTSKDSVTVSMVTAEGYLDRRTVGDYSNNAGQNEIASDLVVLFAADSDEEPGLPFIVEFVGNPGTNPVRQRTYLEADNATVYTRLTELSGVDGGIEFTVAWAWAGDQRAIIPVVLIGDRIGVTGRVGAQPTASFTMPGNVTNAQQVRDYSDGKGGNRVVAYSSGQGDSVPTSGPILAANLDGRPIFDYRYQPSSSIIDPKTLQDYARKALAVLAPGGQAVTLTCELLPETQHGGLWSIGDDVYYEIGGTDTAPDGSPVELVRTFPGGIRGVGRSIAYELTDTTVAPILATATIPGSEADAA